MPEKKSAQTYNSFLDALRSEIAAGNESLSSWIKHIHSRGAIDSLFELETWLKGVRSFLNMEHLPLADSEKEDLLGRSFLSEIRIVRRAVQLCEMHACTVMQIGDREVFEFEKIIENQIRKDRILDFHISHYLDQMTPVDSLSALLDALNDLRISIDAYQRLPNPGYQLFLALGRNYRQELKNCRYVDMLLSQRFRIQYDLIENKSLMEVLRGLPDEQVRRNTALALLYLFRFLRYLKLVQEDLRLDRPLRHHLVLFSLIHEEMDNLSNFLRTRFLKGKDPGRKLRNAADVVAYSLKTESRRILSRELVFLSRETDPATIYARMENSHGVLQNCCQGSIMSLVHAVDKDFREETLFPKRAERIASGDSIRRELWELRKWLMEVIEGESGPDINSLIERLTVFKDRSLHSLMYRDWAEFETLTEILAISNSPAEILACVRKLVNFIEDLIQEVSKRGTHQHTLTI